MNRITVLKLGSALPLALLATGLLLAAPTVHAAPPFMTSLDRGRRDLPALALTFDGGSDAGDTLQILDTLASRGVAATFFLTGDFIRRNPDLARRIAGGGHEVGNHTWSHPHLTAWDRNRRHETLPGVDAALVRGELASTAAAFAAATGRSMAPLWRAPYGEVNAEIAAWASAAGWRHVGWSREERGGGSLDALDWVPDRGARTYLTSSQIVARILGFDAAGSGLNGGIVLMHLCVSRSDRLADRLGPLIDALRGRGYALVTVGALERDLDRPLAIVALR